MKALVVDDDVTSRLVLEEALCHFGKVDSCGDGAEAVHANSLALGEGEPYDLICMDILMPTMNGLEALQLIRQEEERLGRQRTVKVIVITGSEDAGNVSLAFGRLCDAYIVKPIDRAEFLDILQCTCEINRG
jgi:two-component system chemotaxis response regulator CheY